MWKGADVDNESDLCECDFWMQILLNFIGRIKN